MSDLVPILLGKIRQMILPSALVLALAGAPILSPVHAAGDEDEQPTCRKGLIWDKKKQMCIPAQSGVLSDDALAEYAFSLSGQKRYQDALDVLALAVDQNNAKILNYRGFATRNLGRIDEGIQYYRQALALDAENVLVRSYLGQAYLKKGNVGKAVSLLGEIRDRCGVECKAYVDLAAAIKDHG